MTQPHPPLSDGYTPGRRTALVLGGTGTSGAYHAGVLRALHETGVRVDVVAGCGVGAVGAVFAAIDAGARLWDQDGLWRSPDVRRAYCWRPGLRAAGWSLAFSLLSVIVPVLALLAGLVTYPLAYLVQVVGVPGGTSLVEGYGWLMTEALAPGALPALLPRVAVVGLAVFTISVGLVALAGRDRRRRAGRGGLWWTLLAAPLSARVIVHGVRSRLWRAIAGAPGRREPPLPEFSRLYAELLADNLGQPGFRELLFVVHDLDARRDLVYGLLSTPWRRRFFGAQAPGETGRRSAEAFDLAGVARVHVLDALLACLALPGVTEPRLVAFAPESHWRGEAHRLAARAESVGRLLEELARAGVEQVIAVSASPEVAEPHSLRVRRADVSGRLGEHLSAAEAAAFRDALAWGAAAFARVFSIVPAYNPLASFDFRGAHDERSDRRHALAEAVERGYEDAYRQFIEPFVVESSED